MNRMNDMSKAEENEENEGIDDEEDLTWDKYKEHANNVKDFCRDEMYDAMEYRLKKAGFDEATVEKIMSIFGDSWEFVEERYADAIWHDKIE